MRDFLLDYENNAKNVCNLKQENKVANAVTLALMSDLAIKGVTIICDPDELLELSLHRVVEMKRKRGKVRA